MTVVSRVTNDLWKIYLINYTTKLNIQNVIKVKSVNTLLSNVIAKKIIKFLPNNFNFKCLI